MDDLTPSSSSSSLSEAISFLRALEIPGIIHYSLALFFAKFVSYSFLFWLPVFLKSTTSLDSRSAALFSTFFDAGGIFGGVVAGVASDHVGSAQTSVFMMLSALPALHWLQMGFHSSVAHDFLPLDSTAPSSSLTTLSRTHSSTLSLIDIVVLLSCGFFIQGPKTIITTTVSAALGEHPSLATAPKEGEAEEETEEETEEEGKDVGKRDDDVDDVGEKLLRNSKSEEEKLRESQIGQSSNLESTTKTTMTTKTSASSTGNASLSSSLDRSPKLPRKPSTVSLSHPLSDIALHPHKSHPLKALSTVTAIIDGSGSLGAALGPLLTGVVLAPFGWRGVVFMWICCNLAAALPLVLIVFQEKRKR